ncbi:MAG: hypothetical protein PHE24_01345 [Patescibacteria group bacterium]|nr:hypothetical protein [Patescibacteria group bacterium]
MDNFEQLPPPAEEKKLPGPALPQASLADISPASSLPTNSQPQPKARRPKFLLIFLIILVVILLSAGGAFAYVYNYKPELMPSFLSSLLKPQDVLKRMYLAVTELKSFEFDGSDVSAISYEPTTPAANAAATGTEDMFATEVNPFAPTTPGNFNLNVTYQGALDWHDKHDFKVHATTGLELGGDGLDLGFFKIPPFKLQIDLKKFAQSIYAKANLALKGDDGILSALPVDSAQFFDKWVRFDLAAATSTDQELSVKEAFDKYKAKFELTDEQIAAIKKLLYNSNIVKVTAKLPDEKINGVDTFHYRYSYDKEALIKFVEAADDVSKGKLLADVNKADWIKQVSEAKFPESEIWIGKKDFLPYQSYFSSTTVSEFAGLKVTVKSDSTLKLKNFNQPVTVEKPAASVTLAELLENTLGVARAKARDAKRVADIKQIQTALELYYDDNGRYPASFDLSGSGSLKSDTATYMYILPANPEPRTDGGCPDENYSYSTDSAGTSYQLNYCLGGEAAGIPAGPNIATPSGISDRTTNGSAHPLNSGDTVSSSAPGNAQSDVDNGQDSDQDGLTDWQETNIYHTDPNIADTDGDGYQDGAEVESGYNPNGPGKLSPW